ncbi:cytochrome c oxidase subunit 2 [Sphingomonas sp. OV641]|uniref:c-type cytochrome n=1 Tax=Sphingomonas sp. OV641 TaxID=1881068 RepID=UPI0008AA9F52|nr:cytochrome c oxidase subunit 2 [Sphingomonas sp. OV641]
MTALGGRTIIFGSQGGKCDWRLPFAPALPAFALLALAGCNRHQSALATFGEEAAGIAHLSLVMVIGALVIAAALLLLFRWAVRAPEGSLSLRGGERLIVVAGAVLPSVLLLGLLIYSLPAMKPRPTGPGDLTIDVTGEQFWWRVRYHPPGAAPVDAANAIRIPVGRTVRFRLHGGDVVHAFWIPGLAGKMDMIPGRVNELPVRAVKPGLFRGQCTEFCGLSHALMAFEVIAMEPAAFDRWLAAERQPARAAAGASGEGRALFASYGCGGCHQIRGTGEGGLIGPDLTHFAARRTVGAGTLPMDPAAVARFIRHPSEAKPGARMPAFSHMSEAEASAIARYLGELR